MSDDRERQEQAARLVRAAFLKARASGKPEWAVMKLAVLKNRLLDLSERRFREADYGVAGLREFVAQQSSILQLRGDTVAFIGTLDASAEEVTSVPPREPPPRMRPDLWAALTDYRSGKRYAWDLVHAEARPARPEDSLIIPTVSPGDLARWRDEFTAMQPSAQPLEEWRSHGLGTRFLPVELQGPWNGFVREKVAARVEEWFRGNGIEPPQLLVAVRGRDRSDPAAREIREALIACVRAMTLDELREIRVPAAVVARVLAR
jgi:hypothetical protein